MYSFEGNFRSTPLVSLGGRSKQDKLDKAKLLQKAQKERQKREDIRRRLHSALVLQSAVRSYLVRQRLKRQLRESFDQERSQETQFEGNIDRIIKSCRWLRFFYNTKSDNDRLTWLGQYLLRHKTEWISNNDEALFLNSEVLKLCCRSLSTIDASSTLAIPLRMLETFTSADLIKQRRQSNDDAEDGEIRVVLLALWARLIKAGFFKTILHLLSTRVPAYDEPESPSDEGPSQVRPPTPLASTLLSLVARPLVIAAAARDLLKTGENPDSMDTSYDDMTREYIQTIIKTFIKQVLCKNPASQLYNYVYPALGISPEFPAQALLTTLEESAADFSLTKSSVLLAAVMKMMHPKLDSMSHSTFVSYLGCLQWLISTLPRMRLDDDDSASSDEDNSDDESAEKISKMEFTSYGAQGTGSVPLAEIIADCHKALSSRVFIDACVNRRIHEQQDHASIDSVCAICHHLIAITRTTVQKNRLLFTLAFSSSFLRRLWQSTVTTATRSKITGENVPLVQLLFGGSHMTEEESSLIRSKLVVFCTLFSHNLLSVHDADFYGATPSASRHMAFSTSELVSIAVTLRDACLSLIKRALPETRSRLRNYNIRTVLHALSTGQAVRFEKQQSGGRDTDTESREINESIFLFSVCRRLVKHLHTRDVRRAFMPRKIWLSDSIHVKNEQSNAFAHRWHQRSESNSAVAAHLANTSDEDIVLSVTEARQLAVLMNIHFVISFETRVSIFTAMLRKDRENRETSRDRILDEAGIVHSSFANEVTVRREFLYEDAYNDLSKENAPDLRRRLRVTFVNSAGLDEAGYGAGVTREFLQQVMKTGFDPSRGFFQTTAQGRLYPNPHASTITEESNQHFHFLGRMLGKVIYEGMQVELPFASFFLCKILQRKNADVDINHLQSLDPDFYKNLMFLHDYDGDVSELDLNFAVVDESLGITRVTELIPDGKNTPVTNANKVLYMHLMANYKLNVQMRSPCLHFRRGLESVVTVDWLHMFDHQEFQTLVSGAEIPIDIADLKEHAAYSGGYTVEHPTIEAFWNVLAELTNEQLSHFLLFVTSCSRPPLLGFKELHPPFCIQRGGTEDRLPTASTCLNLLKLPEYPDVESLRSKLIYCLQSGSGFELS